MSPSSAQSWVRSQAPLGTACVASLLYSLITIPLALSLFIIFWATPAGTPGSTLQKLLLARSGDHMGYLESNLGQPSARQATLCAIYHSSPVTFFMVLLGKRSSHPLTVTPHQIEGPMAKCENGSLFICAQSLQQSTDFILKTLVSGAAMGLLYQEVRVDYATPRATYQGKCSIHSQRY